jgi:hypothetical protein
LSIDYNALQYGRNAIINGAFEINQRNFSSQLNFSGFGPDRFIIVGADGATASIQEFAPGDTPGQFQSPNFFRFVTSGQTLASARADIQQRIEDVRTFAGQTVTLSFYAKAASGAPKIAPYLFQNFGSGGSSAVNIIPAQITIGTSWNKYSTTFTIPSITGKTIGANSTLVVQLWVSAGSNFNSQTNSLGIQSNTFDIWGVQLEAGPTATPFRRNTNSIQGELAACQRYYQRITSDAGFGVIGGSGFSISATIARMQFPLLTTLRANPTSVEFSGIGVWDTANVYNISAVALTNVGTPNAASLQVTANFMTAFRPATFICQASAGGFLAINAEL